MSENKRKCLCGFEGELGDEWMLQDEFGMVDFSNDVCPSSGDFYVCPQCHLVYFIKD